MAAQIKCTQKAETIFLTIEELPAFQPEQDYGIVQQIAAYFRRLLESYQQNSPPYVLIPAAIELSCFFKCAELHIFEALQEMKEQAFDYEVRGWDGPITLRDPLGRKKVHLPHLKNIIF